MVKIEQTGGRLTEEEILHGKEDAYGIYQINRKGAGRDYAFLSFDSLRSKGKVPERTEYQLVYSDILGVDENRDSLFTKFNIAHPDDFTGHSLSVSDIILIKRNGKVNVSYVDMIGFVPLPDFYKEPSLRVVEQITESTKGFTAEGHFGTWHSIQMQEFHNEKFFQMRHDEFGEQVADIIVNEQGQVIAEDLWHGFSPEAMKLIGEYLLSKSLYQKKEVAYLLPDNGYFMIHETDGGYDYTFYNHEFKELDGGVYDNPEVSIAEATEDILNDEGITIENIRETDYEQLEQDIEEAEYIVKVDFYVAECSEFPSLGEYHEGLTLDEAIKIYEQITESTKGFTAEGHFGTWHSIQMQEFHNEKFFQMRHDEFGEQVADIIVNEQGQVIAEDLWHGFSPEAMKLIGEYLLSKSLYQKKEVAYLLPDNGYFMIHETDGGYDYTFYNHEFKELDGGVYDNPEVSIAEATEDILNDEGITIENIRETDYEQLEQDIEEAEYIVKVDFYVAECSEFPSLGEYHEGLTLDEAIKIYEKIPEERMHGRKGIGIDLHFPEENLYPGKCSLFEGGEICREFLDIVPFYKENKEVQKAVNYLENHFNKKEKSLMKPKKPEQAPRL